MTSVSLSVAFAAYRPAAESGPARDIAPPRAGAKTDPPKVQESCRQDRCDAPRHSPLFRALMEALDSVVGSAQAAGVKAAEAPGTAAPVTPAPARLDEVSELAVKKPESGAPVELEQAVMSFARALMQVMRGVQASDDGAKGEGREHRIHHHHHRHHQMAWGGPAQRVEQLGVKMGAASEKPVLAEATAPILAPAQAADPSAVAASDATDAVSAAEASADPVSATLPERGAAPSTMVYVKLSIDDLAPWAAAADRAEQSLLNAFGTLRKALGADETDDRPSVREQLSAFLQALADKLRTGEDDGRDSTRPGALLDITA